MRLKVQVVIESESGEAEMVQEVAKLERHGLRPESLGLTLSGAKALLQEVQRVMATHQSAEYVTQQLACPNCGRIRSQKGKHQVVFRTLFGAVRLESPRLYPCGCCRKEAPRSFSPLAALLPERTAPELAYLETKFAALISYGLTAELLAEVLPTSGEINAAGVHRNVQRVAQRLEAELGEEKGQFIEGCQRDWDALPPPGPPITVGLDSGFVHAKAQESRGEGWFKVIAGKSVPVEGIPKCFASVQAYDPKPKRRLFELLKAQGLQANQQMTFLSDGAEDVRELPLYLSPESEHWLDWFHVSMRLTGMGQLAKGLANEQAEGPETAPAAPPEEASEETLDLDAGEIGKQLERVKWFLWHGNAPRALETIEDVEDALDLLSQEGESRRKLVTAVREFGRYIEANQNFIPNSYEAASVKSPPASF
ncbi:MAG: ISKra4 family transposase [Acetobacteraceae bacterium]|nr:ISKra4 family transposase [Acetobacteraceae bacterium]